MKRNSTASSESVRQSNFEGENEGSRILEQDWERLSRFIPVEHGFHLQVTGPGYANIPSQELIFCDAIRALTRTVQRHVIIKGETGTGRTAVLKQLASRVVSAGSVALSLKHAIYLDVTHVGPEESRGFLESLLVLVADESKPTVLLVDGLAALVVRSQGRNNHGLLNTLLRLPHISCVGTATSQEFMDQIGSDARLVTLFECLNLDEMPVEHAIEIANHLLPCLASVHRLGYDTDIAERTVTLTNKFILSERQPRKAVHVLQRVFEDRAFERMEGHSKLSHVTNEDIAHAVSRKCRVPLHTILGRSNNTDYRQVLEDAIFGQADAVHQASVELQMIAAGLSEPNKPASVLMFAGTTGVGKTELAKRIAQLYSSTGQLKIYPMGNFTESHSVSGIIGVPPGYVGHEQGGLLVSDLLADPFSVFLLDEAEKCHPNVWKPFLNLFDEGWVIDQLGRKAYADRAIFILTTNAGDRSISQLAKSGKCMDEIAQQVRKTLSRVRQERSSQPVFPPQFLSRIRRIIVFSPLEVEGLVNIARRASIAITERWQAARGKNLHISNDVVTAIGRRGNELNLLVNGEEGGRIVAKLFRDLVEYAVLNAAVEQPQEYDNCKQIRVELAGHNESVDPQIAVSFV